MDVSGFTQAITDGGAAALTVCIAWGVAVWAVRSVRLLRDAQPRYGNRWDPGDYEPEDYDAVCPGCGWEMSDVEAEGAGYTGECRKCGEILDDETNQEYLRETLHISEAVMECGICGAENDAEEWFNDAGDEVCPECGARPEDG